MQVTFFKKLFLLLTVSRHCRPGSKELTTTMTTLLTGRLQFTGKKPWFTDIIIVLGCLPLPSAAYQAYFVLSISYPGKTGRRYEDL